MSPFSEELPVFELAELVPDGVVYGSDPDLAQEDRDEVETRSADEIALPGRW
jgi:hypothetical protein